MAPRPRTDSPAEIVVPQRTPRRRSSANSSGRPAPGEVDTRGGIPSRRGSWACRSLQAEDGAGWLGFFRDLTARGLAGVQLVTSDAHRGLVEAIGATRPGAAWQRCRTTGAVKKQLVLFACWARRSGMCFSEEVMAQLGSRIEVVLPHLNERQRRLVLAQEARLLGHGGVRAVAQAAGVSETTVRSGVFELEAGGDPLPGGRARRAGGGRRPAEGQDRQLVPALLGLVEPDERGDPMSPLRWTAKSLRTLAGELARQGHPVSAPTVGRLLREHGFSLQANAKTLEGKQHPDRDAQFRYINEQARQHQAAGQPVISVDAKKKEHLGWLPNPGRQWRPTGDPVRVEDHSFFFTGPDVPHAIPYGIYDLAADRGWVSVGVDHDTSAFAVASIRRWWQARGRGDYPGPAGC